MKKQIEEIKTDFIDDDNLQHIDVYVRGSEEGEVAGVVCLDTGKEIIFNNGWRVYPEVMDAINEVKKNASKYRILQGSLWEAVHHGGYEYLIPYPNPEAPISEQQLEKYLGSATSLDEAKQTMLALINGKYTIFEIREDIKNV